MRVKRVRVPFGEVRIGQQFTSDGVLFTKVAPQVLPDVESLDEDGHPFVVNAKRGRGLRKSKHLHHFRDETLVRVERTADTEEVIP